MNVGKTSVACEIIKHMSRAGLKISAAKLAGVAAMKDTENMKDYGAKQAVTFVDAGYTSTVKNNGTAVFTAKGAIDYLSAEQPNYIVIEFGDGILGEYGVMDILKDKEIQKIPLFISAVRMIPLEHGNYLIYVKKSARH